MSAMKPAPSKATFVLVIEVAALSHKQQGTPNPKWRPEFRASVLRCRRVQQRDHLAHLALLAPRPFGIVQELIEPVQRLPRPGPHLLQNANRHLKLIIVLGEERLSQNRQTVRWITRDFPN